MGLDDFWEEHAEAWVRWAREPGHDSYWLSTATGFSSCCRPPVA